MLRQALEPASFPTGILHYSALQFSCHVPIPRKANLGAMDFWRQTREARNIDEFGSSIRFVAAPEDTTALVKDGFHPHHLTNPPSSGSDLLQPILVKNNIA